MSLYIVCIAIIICVLLIIYITRETEYEEFSCPSCSNQDWLGESHCYKCNNCGWCIDRERYGSCVVGDMRGPLFREDCRSWFYKGRCLWGPDCGYTAPIYHVPWYYNWIGFGMPNPYMGMRRRHRRRYRRPKKTHNKQTETD
jgi:hypothetical protein